MVWLQIVNGAAAGIGFAASHIAYQSAHPSTVHATVAHLVNATALMWYCTINLAFGLGLVQTSTPPVALFRSAFAVLILSYAARQVLFVRRVVPASSLIE